MAFVKKQSISPLTEGSVQELLYKRCAQLKHEFVIPNTSVAFGWEADLLSINKNLLVSEYEIKVSRSDWLAEIRKSSEPIEEPCPVTGISPSYGAKAGRHNRLLLSKEFERSINGGTNRKYTGWCINGIYARNAGPNYFWLVTAQGIVKEPEIPAYAGLIEVVEDLGGWKLAVVREAPRLHRLKINADTIIAMTRGLSLRYWQLRCANDNEPTR